jgi:hypothetical protein
MDPVALVTYIENLTLAVGAGTTDALTAWNTVSGIVMAKRDPTPDEWALANAAADTAHAAVQG